ncbi:hypothetical protein EDD18DRAFT_1114220 [Armillaria luteobubalina]|uniref:Uncharacterized protein n=1 Tax=Armillaria luteobubalina TaxID=153913 RepID=A0AA39P6L4_9AGAR|nr:hypothetical protein EDD18DRAFT_1114220 [Armillaria luteobubalina]
MYEVSKPNAPASIAAPTLDLKMQSRKARVSHLYRLSYWIYIFDPREFPDYQYIIFIYSAHHNVKRFLKKLYTCLLRALLLTLPVSADCEFGGFDFCLYNQNLTLRAMPLAGPPFVISNNRVARRMARLTDYRPSLPFVNRRGGHEHNWRLPVPRHHSTRALPWTTLWQTTSAFFLAQEYKDVAFISSQRGRHTSLGCKEGAKSYEYDLADSGAAWGWSGLIAVGWSIPFTLYSNIGAVSRRAQAVQAVPGQPPLITVLSSKHNSTMTTGGGGKQRVNGHGFSYGFTRMFELISTVEISWSMSCYIISGVYSRRYY